MTENLQTIRNSKLTGIKENLSKEF
ncbi:uncharacterized protein METZ01_LOCUS401489 [marine metagenome]|uniref:Uncharacterized protein n=1 Tax=marine metagenome TaxID=408172 RepID=A0A382VRJ4_9ZZZZ